MSTAIQLPELARIRGGIASVVQPMPVAYDKWRNGVRVWRSSGGETFVQPGFCIDGIVDEENDQVTVENKPFTELDQNELEFKPFLAGGTAMCAPGETEVGDTTMSAARAALAENSEIMLLEQMFTGDAGVTPSVALNPVFTDNMTTVANSGVGSVEAVDALLEDACLTVTSEHFFLAHRGRLATYVKQLDLKWDEAAGVYRYGQWIFAFDCLPDDDALFLAPRPYLGEGPEIVVDHNVQRQNTRMVLLERMLILAYHWRDSYRTTVDFA